jgi:translation initiation factor IF-3
MPGSNYTINDRIRAEEIRVVEGLPVGIYSKKDALYEAKNLGLDLVLISAKATPPVCKVVDFKKFLYEEKKRKKEQEANQIKVIVKEVQFGPNIGEHDYETKKRNVIKFLSRGNKVKCIVFFKGRTIVYKDRGELVLARLATEVEEYGNPEAMPKMMGKRMSFIIKPKKNK